MGERTFKWTVQVRLFFDRLKKTQGRENSSLKKITQNSSKKLKVSGKFEKITTNIDPNKGEIHCNGWNTAKIPHFKLKYGKNSQFLRGNWLLWSAEQEQIFLHEHTFELWTFFCFPGYRGGKSMKLTPFLRFLIKNYLKWLVYARLQAGWARPDLLLLLLLPLFYF